MDTSDATLSLSSSDKGMRPHGTKALWPQKSRHHYPLEKQFQSAEQEELQAPTVFCKGSKRMGKNCTCPVPRKNTSFLLRISGWSCFVSIIVLVIWLHNYRTAQWGGFQQDPPTIKSSNASSNGPKTLINTLHLIVNTTLTQDKTQHGTSPICLHLHVHCNNKSSTQACLQ